MSPINELDDVDEFTMCSYNGGGSKTVRQSDYNYIKIYSISERRITSRRGKGEWRGFEGWWWW